MDVYHYECYDSKKGYIHTPDIGTSLSYGDLVSCDKSSYPKTELFIMPNLLSGSDYSNSSVVEISNHRTFLDLYKDVEGVHDVWGGFGSYAVAIRLDVYEANKEIQETINSLDDWAILSSDDLSELEREKSDEAWDNWARHDMLNLIHKSHEYLEDYDDDNFDEFFYRASDEANVYWEPESGGSMYIDLEKITPYLRDLLLAETTELKDLPLLISHDWVSKYAQKIYTARLSGEPNE